MLMRLTSLLLAALLLTLAPDGGWRRAAPDDGLDRQRPAVAVADDGRAVVVWSGFDRATGSFEIMARRYDAAGGEEGPAFRVNAYSTGSQRRPAVAVAAGGAFMVVWDGPGSGQDPAGGSVSGSQRIWGRSFDPDGAPRGGDFAINSTPADGQRAAAVAIAPNGDVVVAWGGVVPGDAEGVAFARLTINGVALGAGDERPYDLPEYDIQSNPTVAAGAAGEFVLAWESAAADGARYRLLARGYSADGAALGEPFELRPASAAPLRDPALAFAAGGLAAAWAERDAGESQGRIWLRGFELPGAPLAAPVELSLPGAADRYGPSLAALPSGGLAVAWADATTQSAGAPVGVALRLLDATGMPEVGELYPGRPPTQGFAAVSSVSAGAGGDALVVAWDNDAAPAGGGPPVSGIYLRRYAEPPRSMVYLPLLRR